MSDIGWFSSLRHHACTAGCLLHAKWVDIGHFGVEACHDMARGNRIGTDIERAVMRGNVFRHPDNGMLSSRIGQSAASAHDTGKGGHIHDSAAAVCFEVGENTADT